MYGRKAALRPVGAPCGRSRQFWLAPQMLYRRFKHLTYFKGIPLGFQNTFSKPVWCELQYNLRTTALNNICRQTRVTSLRCSVSTNTVSSTLHVMQNLVYKFQSCIINRYLLDYISNSTKHSPSWEADRSSTNQEIPRILWKPNVHSVFKRAAFRDQSIQHKPSILPLSYLFYVSSQLFLRLRNGLFP